MGWTRREVRKTASKFRTRNYKNDPSSLSIPLSANCACVSTRLTREIKRSSVASPAIHRNHKENKRKRMVMMTLRWKKRTTTTTTDWESSDYDGTNWWNKELRRERGGERAKWMCETGEERDGQRDERKERERESMVAIWNEKQQNKRMLPDVLMDNAHQSKCLLVCDLGCSL